VHWWNAERLHGYLHDVPPIEFEAAYAAEQADQQLVGIQKPESPSNPRGFTSPERAALVENRAPNTSEYLLTGMLRCRACGGAYIGAGTKGRNGFYRYDACRNRQTKGTYGCRSRRVPAEDLEAGVIDDLIRTLSRSDLVEQALAAAIAEVADSRPRLEAELASTEAQLRDTEAGLNHYLQAFETGEMPAAICSPRVTELTQRRDELVAHCKQLTAQLKDATPQLPTLDQLRALCTEIRRTIEDGNPDAVKQLLRELIDRVEITPERHAYPYFWVPATARTETPTGPEPGPDASPASAHSGDTGWLFVTSGGAELSLFEPPRRSEPTRSRCRAAARDGLTASYGSATIVAVSIEPLRAVRDHLSEVIDRVEYQHERIIVTRNGHEAAVLISVDDLAELEETIDVLSDPDALADIREADQAYARGDVVRGVEAVRRLRG
jgi:prevent-host-death family protein